MRLVIDHRETGPAALAVARALDLDLATARALVARRAPVHLSMRADSARVEATLRGAGISARVEPAPASTGCSHHAALAALGQCQSCRASICAACEIESSGRWCATCAARLRRARAFRNARVAVLLLVLVGIAGWGFQRSRARGARRNWNETLTVAVVLVSPKPIPPATVAAWSRGLASLEGWAQSEYERHRSRAFLPPITFRLATPVVSEPPPIPAAAETLPARAAAALEFSRAAEAIDGPAGVTSADQVVIDVVLEAHGGDASVEGLAEAGGRRGVVRAGLDETSLGLELSATAHEVFHCLGATDKYGPEGHALLPAGLVDPDLEPTFPQPFAEVMVGEIPTGEASGRGITRLEEVRVGPVTAREIGWSVP